METLDRIVEFKTFFNNRLDAEKTSIEMASRERDEYLDEFPLSRIKELTAEEYCLGTEHSKESLCYLIEFGKYKQTGFGIGGGSSKKYGVYYSQAEQCYKHGANPIDDIEVFWPQFRDEMYRFLVDSENTDSPVSLEEYPLLRGMAMVLTKFLCLYFPLKYFTIGSYSILKDLMDCFHYNYSNEMKCHEFLFQQKHKN